MTLFEMIKVVEDGLNGEYCAIYYDDDKDPELGFLQNDGNLIIIRKLSSVEIDGTRKNEFALDIESPHKHVCVYRCRWPLWVEDEPEKAMYDSRPPIFITASLKLSAQRFHTDARPDHEG